MSEEKSLQTEVVEKTQLTQKTIETVKACVFKGANDDELQLYFHKCLALGCHPLDGLIIPSKFKDNERGGTSVVFITTIDYFRSAAEDSGEYDGQDPIEFDGTHEFGNMIVPERAIARVYKKGQTRPYVGEAYWTEFCPSSQNKQFMWKKMPRIMLAKCAEAQAMRKAFPKKLHGLYAGEEMDQAVRAELGSGASTKPTNVEMPKQLPPKTLTNTQLKQLHTAITNSPVSKEAFKAFLKDKYNLDTSKNIKQGAAFEWMLDTIKNRPEYFDTYKPQEQEQQQQQPVDDGNVQDAEFTEVDDRTKTIKDLAKKAGCNTKKGIEDILQAEFSIGIDGIDEISAEGFDTIVKFFESLIQG